MAYRYITSDCSGYAKPVSDESVRVLTALASTVRTHCVDLQHEHGAKFWWAIDSLDIVPCNIDLTTRSTRQLSAYDLDKCFESIPLLDGEHSLMKHVEFFVDLAFRHGDGEYLSAQLRYDGVPARECYWTDSPDQYRQVQYSASDVINLVKTMIQMTYITVGLTAALQHLGIPMGYSASVILLNIYAFKPEYLFTWRLVRMQPELAHNTLELYRYVDDLGNFSDLDLRPYLDPGQQPSEQNPFWIYPLTPLGPLSMSDQTDRQTLHTEVIYLNMRFVLTGGVLTYEWYQKHTTYKFRTCRLTHWDSYVAHKCKCALVTTMARIAILAASNQQILAANLKSMLQAFRRLEYPDTVLKERLSQAMDKLLSRLPPQLLRRLQPEIGVQS